MDVEEKARHGGVNAPQAMRALQMRAPGALAPATLPIPAPGPRDVLIRTLAATICTSDLHDLARNPFNIPLPRVLGHEAAGVVVACGAQAREFAPGTRVAVHPVVPCGACAECARGFGHLCARMGHLGSDRDGAFAEYFVQRADRVRRLPDGMPASTGALLEPVAVCLQAIARAGEVRGRDVLVAGDGPFGNLIARLAARGGARRVAVLGREPFRLSRIPGAEALMSAPPARSVDVAILAVSSAEAAAACLAALRPRGRLVVFSALHEPAALDLFSLHLRELEIVGACNDEDRLDEAMDCLRDPALALHEIVTHELPFAQWAEAFALARDGHDRALKVALVFPEAA
jgi:2-desacetyl-2-hydroxyethyl bacteriochlorophyllide A dehydrogenase